jgi:hypothetical protein
MNLSGFEGTRLKSSVGVVIKNIGEMDRSILVNRKSSAGRRECPAP